MDKNFEKLIICLEKFIEKMYFIKNTDFQIQVKNSKKLIINFLKVFETKYNSL